MSWSSSFPGDPIDFNFSKIGGFVEAADWQKIIDWFRWFFVYFIPAHNYSSSIQGGRRGFCRGGDAFFIEGPRACVFDDKSSLLACGHRSSYDVSFYCPSSEGDSVEFSFSSQPSAGNSAPVLWSGGSSASNHQFSILLKQQSVISYIDLWQDVYKP